jgi:hypothetical protein
MIDPYSQKLADLAEALLSREQRPDPIQRCPVCGDRLATTISARHRLGRSFASISFDCLDCGAAADIDGFSPVPAWLHPGE